MSRSFVTFFIFICFSQFQQVCFAQKSNFQWIKPYKADSKNIKIFKNLYRTASYRAGYLSMEYKVARKLFKGKSGIAVESIPTSELLRVPLWQSETFDHKTENEQLSGSITSFERKKELFKEARDNAIEWDYWRIFNDKIKIPLHPKKFSVPIQGDSKNTIRNLVLVRKKRICKIQPFQGYGGCLFTTPFPDLKFQFSRKVSSLLVEKQNEIVNDTISLKLYYQRGSVSLEEVETKELQQQIANHCGKIVKVDITVYASVEGTYQNNSEIYTARAKSMVANLQNQLSEEVIYEVKAKENWRLFRDQILNTKYSFLKKYPKSRVRQYVNKNANRKNIAQWLQDQRYVELKIIFRNEIKDDTMVEPTLSYYQYLVDQIKQNGFTKSRSLINKLEEVQINLYSRNIESGEFSWRELDQLEIPNYSTFNTLRFNKVVFNYLAKKSGKSERRFFDQLIKMGIKKNVPHHLKKAIQFNTQILLFKAVEDGTLSFFVDLNKLPLKAYRDYIFRLVPSSTDKSTSDELNDRIIMAYLPGFINTYKNERLSEENVIQLFRFYHTYLISSYYVNFYPETKRKADKQLSGIYKYFSENKISSNQERISVVQLYILFQKWEKALETLEPLKEDPEFRILAIQLSLSCKQFVLDYESLIDEILSARFDLGYENWIEMFERPDMLGPRYFDNARIREYYYSY